MNDFIYSLFFFLFFSMNRLRTYQTNAIVRSFGRRKSRIHQRFFGRHQIESVSAIKSSLGHNDVVVVVRHQDQLQTHTTSSPLTFAATTTTIIIIVIPPSTTLSSLSPYLWFTSKYIFATAALFMTPCLMLLSFTHPTTSDSCCSLHVNRPFAITQYCHSKSTYCFFWSLSLSLTLSLPPSRRLIFPLKFFITFSKRRLLLQTVRTTRFHSSNCV